MDSLEFQKIVKNLSSSGRESEWLELKCNNSNPDEIGQYISALSNSAALLKRAVSYIVWGIEDKTGNIVGTTFRPKETKVKGQELESWLLGNLDPQTEFHIHEGAVDNKHIVLFEIAAAMHRPIRFKTFEYIRVGTYKKPLSDYPEKERELWRTFEQIPFEKGFAKRNVSAKQILQLIDFQSYLNLMKIPFPGDQSSLFQRLQFENIIHKLNDDEYHITNLGAILFAKNLEDFDGISRKTLRVIFYNDNSRLKTIKEIELTKGYAAGFEEIVNSINSQLPQNEHIGEAFRSEVRMYPQIAIRELIANALIHQDFTISGTGPLVEIFESRVEISNPGLPLIDTLRFIDGAPRSRNEMLAKLMRRMNICEERGTGIDKVIVQIELFQLPPPDFRAKTFSTCAILFAPKELRDMNSEERSRAAYQHACLQYVIGKIMSNESLRKRLGMKSSNYSLASRIIRDTIKAGLVKPQGDVVGMGKSAAYLPFWA